MHELWLAFADKPTEAHQAGDKDLAGRTPRQAFDDARLADALNGREITWMLLIDPKGEQGRLAASYGVSPPILLGTRAPSFAADATTEWHPSIKPTKR
jgi:hypothetical protein